MCPSSSKPQLLADLLTTNAVARALVFTRTKHGADRVARQLNKAGIRAEAMHGNKSQAARQRTLAGFKSNRPPVLVATDVAARGIDVDDVSHVFNYDLPHEPEMYVHRIGRTGRAGASGIAVSFCDHEERKLLQAIERLIRRKLLVDRAVTVSEIASVSAPRPSVPQDSEPRTPARRWRARKRRDLAPAALRRRKRTPLVGTSRPHRLNLAADLAAGQGGGDGLGGRLSRVVRRGQASLEMDLLAAAG